MVLRGSVLRVLLVGAAMAVCALGACSEPSVTESRPAASSEAVKTPAGSSVTTPVAVPRECAPFTQFIVPEEVARWCSRPAMEVVGEGGECVFRLGRGGGSGVRLSVREATAENHEALRAAMAPTRGTPAVLLGSRAFAFYDRQRRASTFIFEVGARLVRLSAATTACEPGPLSRLATILRARLSPPTPGEDAGPPSPAARKGR